MEKWSVERYGVGRPENFGSSLFCVGKGRESHNRNESSWLRQVRGWWVDVVRVSDSCYVDITRLEDRALLGSNPSAKPGVVTLEDLDIFHDFQVSFILPSVSTRKRKTRGVWGAESPRIMPHPGYPH